MNKIQAFISFDPQHDRELFESIATQSRSRNSGFTIVGKSSGSIARHVGGEEALDTIREADQDIVLCGEHSESCSSMTAEIQLAREEDTPYILLCGRRDVMCTKPAGVKSSDGMYSWTLQTLQDQIEFTTRSARWRRPSMSSTMLPSASCHLATPEQLSRRDHFMQTGAPPAAPHDPAVGLHRQRGRHHLGYGV
jgi:hypothetical protein